jgi:hypothetical protein
MMKILNRLSCPIKTFGYNCFTFNILHRNRCVWPKVTICNLKPVTTYPSHQGFTTTLCLTSVGIKHFIITATRTNIFSLLTSKIDTISSISHTLLLAMSYKKADKLRTNNNPRVFHCKEKLIDEQLILV